MPGRPEKVGPPVASPVKLPVSALARRPAKAPSDGDSRVRRQVVPTSVRSSDAC